MATSTRPGPNPLELGPAGGAVPLARGYFARRDLYILKVAYPMSPALSHFVMQAP